MSKHISTGFALTLIALFALVFGTVFWLMGKRDITDVPVVQTTQPISSAVQQTDKVVYENKEFGFSLELPASWTGYKIFEGKSFDLYDKKRYDNKHFTFLLPTTEKDSGAWFFGKDLKEYAYFAPVISIDVIPKEYFLKNEKTCETNFDPKNIQLKQSYPDCLRWKLIGETENFVVLADRVDGGLAGDEKYADKMLAIKSTNEDPYGFLDFFKKSFKLLG